jgi:hypothetical protein
VNDTLTSLQTAQASAESEHSERVAATEKLRSVVAHCRSLQNQLRKTASVGGGNIQEPDTNTAEGDASVVGIGETSPETAMLTAALAASQAETATVKDKAKELLSRYRQLQKNFAALQKASKDQEVQRNVQVHLPSLVIVSASAHDHAAFYSGNFKWLILEARPYCLTLSCATVPGQSSGR